MKNTFRKLGGAAIIGLVMITLASRAEETKAGATNKTAAASTNAAPVEAAIPRSVFVIPTSLAEGRDPFFPHRTGFIVAAATGPGKPTATIPGDLVVKGISGTADRRFCLINDVNFGVGDELDVKTNSGKVRVLCLAIHEDTVTISVGGVRQELKFRTRF
ncbi:MAG: hypothetical protein EPO07_16390 [Verrucomicrobia bacterium]|nr:MAG: hypothetical protein EPO07_16390 [Verrucomicrobiota bacterium]